MLINNTFMFSSAFGCHFFIYYSFLLICRNLCVYSLAACDIIIKVECRVVNCSNDFAYNDLQQVILFAAGDGIFRMDLKYFRKTK